MAVVVATMVVEPLVKIIMEKASNNLLDQYKVMKGMEKQRDILNRRLLAILDIITVAEQAASHKEGVKAWLEAIKKVAYQANKVFDEFKYEVLHREAKRNGQYKELGFDVVKLFATHNRFIFRNRMGRKLWKIVKAIEVLVTEMSTFHFERQQQPPVSNQWREMDHDIFDLKEITNRSRAKDNKNIVDILVGQANNPFLTVVPIVGMGGLGKTTLAQLVYNEPEIQKHFDFLVWVGVSDAFDVDSLAKSIIEAVPEKKVGRKATHSKTPLDSLQNVVTGQRGSVVLTTTRDEGVAEILGTTEAYNLAALDDTFIKEIIETRAFSHLHKEEQRPAVLVNMVGEIVKRCVGSPLAATALGFVLRTKTSSGSDCSKVGELGHLNLGGQLELSSLENVTEKDAAAANLMEKKDIRELTLKWTRRLYYTLSNVNDARVLEKLKPHEGLYAIRIHSYGATTFPMTLARLPNIGEIHLFNCSRLKWLFNRHNDTSFAFPNLKELTLEDLDSLERWWDTDDDTMQGDEIMFPLLEKLYITGCGKLKKLPGRPTFPNLQKASLHRCQEVNNYS
ncbi:hypothetical protein QYE76_036817 [Lolium multiflorum]|uniref:Uncharacterized protein n=1 Tax=Lolium multiflorum TaxID=4521 RepID=A0AAD8VNF4_LOLMU|nr:hypothetical protein QYE76_036817 [Lolium multiflorum]